MSYVLNVWEQPIPRTLEEAEDILGRLSVGKERKSGPKLEAFRQTVLARG